MNGRKHADIMKVTESWNKRFYNCFMAVTLFYTRSKGVSFFVKPLSHGLRKMDVVLYQKQSETLS